MKDLEVLLTREQEYQIAAEIERKRNELLREICLDDLAFIGQYLYSEAREGRYSLQAKRLPTVYLQKYRALEEKLDGGQEENLVVVTDFFKEMNKWNVLDDLADAYLKKLEAKKGHNDHDTTEIEERQARLIKIKSEWYQSRNRLVHANLGLLIEEAQRIHRMQGKQYGALFDLINTGYGGLIIAADKFDPGRNVRFYTYAIRWVKQKIYRDITRRTGLASPEIKTISVYLPIRQDQESLLVLYTLKSDSNPEAESSEKEIPEKILRTIKKVGLTERDKEIILLRAQGMTLQEIGDKVGLTRQGIQQIEKKFIPRLRRLLRSLYEELE